MNKCDRCGKSIVYKGLTSKIEVRKSRLKPILSVISIWNGGVDPYAYTSEEIELCSECTQKFRDFLKNNK